MKNDNAINIVLSLLIIGAVFCAALICTFTSVIDEYTETINEEHEIYDDLVSISKLEYTTDGTDTYIGIDWATLYAINSDVCGWLTIPDTVIDYPVVFSKKSSYLYYDFEQNRNKNGTLFVYAGDGIDEKDKLTEYQNVTIYGHHFKSRNTMFSALLNYKDKGFYEKHKQILFYTPNAGCINYTVIAAFNAYAVNDIPYTYSTYSDFSSLIADIDERNVINIDLNEEMDSTDKFLTLSTCDDTYNGKYGRFVIIAKREEDTK